MADKHAGDPERLHTAAEAASRAAEMATEAARLAEREEAAALFAQGIARVGSAVAHEHMRSGILETVLDQSVLTLGAEFVYVYLADEDQRTLDLVAHRGACRTISKRGFRTSHSMLHRSPPGAPPLDERATLDTCADIFSFGIANAIAYGQERRLHLLFEEVGHATAAIASEFGLGPVLQNIVDKARQVGGAEYAAMGDRRGRRSGIRALGLQRHDQGASVCHRSASMSDWDVGSHCA